MRTVNECTANSRVAIADALVTLRGAHCAAAGDRLSSAMPTCKHGLQVTRASVMKLALSTIVLAGLVGCAQPPALLKDASARSGFASACPYRPRVAENLPLATSPEVTQRLEQRFPPGSPSQRLVDELVKEGFTMGPACEVDSTISSAYYNGPSGGPWKMHGTIEWKTDAAGRIVWAVGFVSYDVF